MYKVHFEISRETYDERVANGEYKTSWDGLSWRDAPKDYDLFHSYLVRVGEKWGWPNMTDRFGKAAMAEKFSHPETRFRELLAFNPDTEVFDVVGYTTILTPDKKLKERFFPAASGTIAPIEIENLGLFPEECGNERGWSFFEMQFKDLFKSYNKICWSMSSTNHPRLQAYYERKGMKVMAIDPIPDYRPTEKYEQPVKQLA